MLIGYARSKKSEEEIDSQVKELKKNGCQEIYTDIGLASKNDLAGFKLMVKTVNPGDIVVVVKISVFGKTFRHFVDLLNSFSKKGVDIISLNKEEHIDTSSSHGKELISLLNILLKCEKEVKREMTQIGLKAARERGRVGGRPSGLSEDAKKIAAKAAKAYKEDKLSITEIAKMLNIARSTLYNYLKHEGVELASEKRKYRRVIKD